MKSQVCIWTLLAVIGAASAQTPSPAVLLQEALYAEQTEGNLDKAIGLYQQVLDQAAEVERLAARATYQIGQCYLKKGQTEDAAKQFRKVVTKFPRQTRLVTRAQAQLKEIAPQQIGGGLYDQATSEVWLMLGNLYGQFCSKASAQGLYTNSNIHFVNADFAHWYGGYGFYMNTSAEPVSGRVRLSGTTYPNLKHYDITGNLLETEIVPDKRPGREKYYHIYLNLPQPVLTGQFYPYAWAVEGSEPVQAAPHATGKYLLTMQNHFGDRAMEVFYLVVPNTLVVEDQTPTVTMEDGSVVAPEETGQYTVGEYTIYAWGRKVRPEDNHLVNVLISPKENILIGTALPKGSVTLDPAVESKESIKAYLGTPDKEGPKSLDYNQRYGFDFFIDDSHIEIHVNPSFKGQLSNGISLDSTADDLFKVYGQPKRTEQTNNLMDKFEEGVLYQMGEAGKFPLEKQGLLFWLKDNQISQIVLFKGLVQGNEADADQKQ